MFLYDNGFLQASDNICERKQAVLFSIVGILFLGLGYSFQLSSSSHRIS